jgi:hypothetical protein
MLLLSEGENIVICSTRHFCREIVHLERQKHTSAGFGLCFAQIAETALKEALIYSSKVELSKN